MICPTRKYRRSVSPRIRSDASLGGPLIEPEQDKVCVPPHPYLVEQWLPRSSSWVRLAQFQFRSDAFLFCRERRRINGNPQSFRVVVAGEVINDEAC